MERAFIATIDSEFIKDYERYKSIELEQRNFINKFFNEKNIESKTFLISGDGCVNQPFTERYQSNITLSIDPTENDMKNYGMYLTKPDKRTGLCSFKKNSALAKEFAQKCIDEKIVINLYRPRVGDYFSSIGWANGCSWEMFNFNDKYYLKIESKNLNAEELPEGFIDIKMSEYYLIKEQYNETNKSIND
jgi:hypothetical protein